jgi:hypothetical protein
MIPCERDFISLPFSRFRGVFDFPLAIDATRSLTSPPQPGLAFCPNVFQLSGKMLGSNERAIPANPEASHLAIFGTLLLLHRCRPWAVQKIQELYNAESSFDVGSGADDPDRIKLCFWPKPGH